MSDKHKVQAIALHDIYQRRLESTLAHPDIDTAINAATLRILEPYYTGTRKPPEYAKFKHIIAESMLIYLHYDYELYERGPGATKTSLTKLSVKHRVLSPRAVVTLVQRMYDTKRIVHWSSKTDSRAKRFAPTKVMLEQHRTFARPFLEALPLIGLDHPNIAPVLSDLSAFAHFRYSVGKLYAMGADPVRPFGIPRAVFSNSAGGIAMANYLRYANILEFGTLTANVPCPINLSYVSETLGVSRAHIRNILDDLTSSNLAHFEHGSSHMTYSEALTERLQKSLICGIIMAHEALISMGDIRSPVVHSAKSTQPADALADYQVT